MDDLLNLLADQLGRIARFIGEERAIERKETETFPRRSLRLSNS